MPSLESLRIKLFSDGADLPSIVALSAHPWIRGFTTNPTLMRKAGIVDYESFGRSVLAAVPDRPVSLEVFADTPYEMEAQALAIAGWGRNVNVKIPVTNQAGEFMGPLIQRLSRAGISLNVTAILTLEQIQAVVDVLDTATPAILSVFAGRIADTGVDPIPVMKQAAALLRTHPRVQLLWASPRELLNIFQANDAGCHIITVPHEILQKLNLIGKDLSDYSRETVSMFYRDARDAAYYIETRPMASPEHFASFEDQFHGAAKIRSNGPCAAIL